MSAHSATVHWERGADAFIDRKYSRAHEWRFDGGCVVAASSSPAAVRIPLSKPENVDPEEAFVAALASCHMLWFLDCAARAGYVVERYTDQALGHLAARPDGKQWVATVELLPAVTFGGSKRPEEASVRRLHGEAHANCFIANSVKTEVSVKGTWTFAGGGSS